MKHLVLGSSGQIGSYVVEAIENRGDEAMRWDVALDLAMDLRCWNEDFLGIVAGVDYVHFLAYEVGGSRYLKSYQDSYQFISDNIAIMENVFECLELTQTPFYFSSSQMSSMFYSTYGRLKAVGEAYTQSLGGNVVHFWNVYGYESNPEKAHVITDFIRMALDQGVILVGTDGSESRQFSYAPWVAKQLLLVADHHSYLAGKGVPIPITNYEWTTVRDVALMIGEKLNAEVYFSLGTDSVQKDALNEPPSPPSPLGIASCPSLSKGIDEVIERIKNGH